MRNDLLLSTLPSNSTYSGFRKYTKKTEMKHQESLQESEERNLLQQQQLRQQLTNLQGLHDKSMQDLANANNMYMYAIHIGICMLNWFRLIYLIMLII